MSAAAELQPGPNAEQAAQNAEASPASERRYKMRTRPASITELRMEASLTSFWDERKSFQACLMLADCFWQDGKDCIASGRLEKGYVQISRAATLALQKLPSHRGYKKLKKAHKRTLLVNGQDMHVLLEKIEGVLTEQYQRWAQDQFLADLWVLPLSISQRAPIVMAQELAWPAHLDPRVRPLPLPRPSLSRSRSAPSSTTNLNQYTLPPSGTESTDYGIYYRRMAYSQETSVGERSTSASTTWELEYSAITAISEHQP